MNLVTLVAGTCSPTPKYTEVAMQTKSERTETRVTCFGSGKRWRFVRTKHGQEYCIEQLLFKGGRLKELDCYRFEENGAKYTVHLRPDEVEDMSEIAEFLNPQQA